MGHFSKCWEHFGTSPAHKITNKKHAGSPTQCAAHGLNPQSRTARLAFSRRHHALFHCLLAAIPVRKIVQNPYEFLPSFDMFNGFSAPGTPPSPTCPKTAVAALLHFSCTCRPGPDTTVVARNHHLGVCIRRGTPEFPNGGGTGEASFRARKEPPLERCLPGARFRATLSVRQPLPRHGKGLQHGQLGPEQSTPEGHRPQGCPCPHPYGETLTPLPRPLPSFQGARCEGGHGVPGRGCFFPTSEKGALKRYCGDVSRENDVFVAAGQNLAERGFDPRTFEL